MTTFDAPMNAAVTAWHNGQIMGKNGFHPDTILWYRRGYIEGDTSTFLRNVHLNEDASDGERAFHMGIKDAIFDREWEYEHGC